MNGFIEMFLWCKGIIYKYTGMMIIKKSSGQTMITRFINDTFSETGEPFPSTLRTIIVQGFSTSIGSTVVRRVKLTEYQMESSKSKKRESAFTSLPVLEHTLNFYDNSKIFSMYLYHLCGLISVQPWF